MVLVTEGHRPLEAEYKIWIPNPMKHRGIHGASAGGFGSCCLRIHRGPAKFQIFEFSGHSSVAELVRSHQAPATVSRSVLTVIDRVHGVGIVVAGTGLCLQPVCVHGVAPRQFLRDGGFRRRFPGRDGGLGGRGAGLRRAAGRGAAGRVPGPRCGALVGWMASIDAVHSVDLVGEWRPARRRSKSSCCAPGGWAA